MKIIPPRQVPQAMARIARLAVLAVMLGWAVLLVSGPGLAAKDKTGKLPKDSVARQQLTMLDGRQFNLAALRGQVVVLDFFAIWCGHSRAHLPALTGFTEADRQRGLQILGLSVQERTTKESLAQFIAEQKIAYPVGLVSDPVFSSFVESRDVSVPQTLVYARDGRLAAHFNGRDDAALVATIKRELEKP
jgi:cytochrome c biogenesis protein CcmG/thiol:disulfide interchange protein DsbE